MTKSFFVTVALFFLGMLVSCIQTGDLAPLRSAGVKPVFEISDPTPTPSPTSTEVVKTTYKMIYEKVLNQRCVGCHKELRTEEEAKIFVVPGDPFQSPLFTYIYDRRMPPFGDPLADDDISLVRKYIEDLK